MNSSVEDTPQDSVDYDEIDDDAAVKIRMRAQKLKIIKLKKLTIC